MRPTAGFPCSSAGSDLADHDQSEAALPYGAISNANWRPTRAVRLRHYKPVLRASGVAHTLFGEAVFRSTR
jgi:hypothetical protein